MFDNKTPVVVGVDGSPGAINGAQWAAAVAEKYETSLHIVHATPILGPNLSDSAAAIMAAAMSYQRDMAELFLREATTTVAAKHPTLRVTTESTHTPADEALIQLSETARMVVLGSPQVTPAGALFIGSTTLAVATHASCPVVAWRGPHTAPTDGSIVVGVDGSHSSAVALGAAFDFADRFAAKIAAVRSWSMRRPAAAVTIPFLIDWDALEAVEWTELTEVVDRCTSAAPMSRRHALSRPRVRRPHCCSIRPTRS